MTHAIAKIGIVVLMLASSTSAIAQPRYDKSIARAAAERIAAKLGDLRGGFSLDSKPEFVRYDESAFSSEIAQPSRYVPFVGKPRERSPEFHSYYDPKKVRVVYAGIIFND